MSRPSDGDRAARAVMALAMVLTLVGSCGIVRGVEVTTRSAPPRAEVGGSVSGELTAASEQANDALREALWDAPLRRPLGAANVIVSAMLLGGAVLLVLRKQSAVWWVTQAVLANVVWTVAEVGSQVVPLVQSYDRLARALDRVVAAQAGDTDTPGWIEGAHGVWITMLVLVLVGMARIAVYLWIWRRVRRSDVREVIGVTAPDDGR